jgi:hypothetical protein
MHVQIISGDGKNGETARLKVLKGLGDWLGQTWQGVHADAYSAASLIEILEVRASTEREILVLECSREQIQAVLEWQSATDEVVELENVLLHMVRKQNIKGESQ